MKKLIAVLLLSSIYYSDVIHVPDDHATIQEGINASVDGDTVLIAQGVYDENLLLKRHSSIQSCSL